MTGPNPSGLCMCGCGQRTGIADYNSPQYGWVKGQPVRFVHGHQGRIPLRWVEEDRGYETPCWVWQLATTNGYGRVRLVSGEVRAHRHVYEQHVGPIPAGLDLDHLCRVRACVNPAHLEPVTRGENLRRGYAARRAEAAA